MSGQLKLKQVARRRRTADVKEKLVSCQASGGHPTLTDETASVVRSEPNQTAGAIVLPSHQCDALDLLSHRTTSDDASELNPPVATADFDSLSSAIAELNRQTGVVQRNVRRTNAKLAPLNHGCPALHGRDRRRTHRVRGLRQADESARDGQPVPLLVLGAH